MKKSPNNRRGIPSDILGSFKKYGDTSPGLSDSMLTQTLAAPQPKPVVKAPPPIKVIEVDPKVPFVRRPFKFHLLRSFLTSFDGQQYPNKLREEGTEHEWIGEQLSMQKSSNWTTQFTGTCEFQKETRFRETNQSLILDPNLIRGEREGKNQYG